MAYNLKGECRNTGRTHFVRGFTPWNKNRVGIYSEECRRKIGEATKKRLLENHPLKGKPRSEKTRKKISLSLLKLNEGKPRKLQYCYHNNLWYELRKIIYKRDNYVCQECGSKSRGKNSLHAHHIDYDTNNNDLSNLITLCNVCHGKINYKKEDWIIRYRAKLNNKKIF